MVETLLTPQILKGPFDIVTAGDLNITFESADNINGNRFISTGREIVLMHNSGASVELVTLISTPDLFNRIRDIAYSIPAGGFAVFTGGLTNAAGWKWTDGSVVMSTPSAAIKFAVLRIP
jgi:hypothetical protein